MSRVAIVACAKSEQKYFTEFVEYHVLLGFDKLVIYDNEDAPTYHALLGAQRPELLPRVLVIHFPGDGVQYRTLEHFAEHYMPDFTHALCIDLDEFVCLKRHDDIKTFIADHVDSDPECAGLGLNWRMFGDAGHVAPPADEIGDGSAYSLLRRFTRCQPGLDRHVKTLYKTAAFVRYHTMHGIVCAAGTQTKSADAARKPFSASFVETNDHSLAQLNHYKAKTFPEFAAAFRRGLADVEGNDRANASDEEVRQHFAAYNHNHEVCTHARDSHAARRLRFYGA